MAEALPQPIDLQPWAVPLEQLIVCLVCRHLPEAECLEDAGDLLAVCCLLCRTVLWLFARNGGGMDGLVEAARMVSAELEYSQENMDAIREAVAEADDMIRQ